MAQHLRTVVFLHIPRTGGTTFAKIPPRNYRPDETLTFNGARHREEIKEFAALPEPQRTKYKFINGHLYFGFHEFLPTASTYATFLREPVGRALSFYNYARAHPDHYLFQAINRDGLSLKDLLERKASHELFNLQTRMIAGDRSGSCLADRAVLERAKQNLREHFCFVGLTEEFGASMILLARKLGWRSPFYVKRNASAKKGPGATIDHETLALVRETNALDLELYQFGSELFREQSRSAGDSFAAECRRFQRINFVGAHVLEQYENLIAKLRPIFGGADRQLPSQT